MSYLSLENDVDIRYSELLKEAEMKRLAKEATAGRPGIRMRALQSLGDTLISLGKNLKSLSLSL